MSLLDKISLSHQWIYRAFHPQGQYHIDFELDNESKYLLGGICTGTDEEVKLKDEIENATRHLVFTMSYKELEKESISEALRMVIDPTNKGRIFSFALKRGQERNHLIVTKVRVTKREIPKESLILKELQSNPLKVCTRDDTLPIIITFSLDEKTTQQLKSIEEDFENEKDANIIRQNIQRAFGQWLYENINQLNPGSYTKEAEGVLDDESNYAFSFTVLNFKRVVVNKLRIYQRDPYKFE